MTLVSRSMASAFRLSVHGSRLSVHGSLLLGTLVTQREQKLTHRFDVLPFALYLSFAACLLLALGLRLVVWRWREFYPLSGDEQEYLKQALTLLQQRQYVELNLMRPPLYTAFLAGSIVLVDSAVQNLRLVQAVISALTVLPLAALTWELFRSRQVVLVAALLFALNYTLAATASELLTETVFLFGLCVALWLIIAAPHRQRGWLFGILAGLTLGALALVRSVALPLVGLATLWLLIHFVVTQPANNKQSFLKKIRSALRQPFFLLPFTFCLLVLPWTARNYATYGAVILIDTTGAENLWLDNNPSAATADDPLGREAAKRELYALGNDRAARQSLATKRGIAEIRSNPAWFAAKAWNEAKAFFALQYFDEMREKRAIWLSPAEVLAKLVLGDGLWLVLMIAAGCTIYDLRFTIERSSLRMVNPAWLLLAWTGYIFATALMFHVELRYRLPVYPVLAPFAALALVRGVSWLHAWLSVQPFAFARLRQIGGQTWLVALAASAALVTITLLHRDYLAESWLLLNKHAALARAERALTRRDAAAAEHAANQALGCDDTSALARVAQARAALLGGNRAATEAALNAAIAALPAHPHAHLLRGALLRNSGNLAAAKTELAFETASLEDLQAWSWQTFAPIGPPPAAFDVGNGLDLGFVQGFYPAESGYRWTKGTAQVQISAAAGSTTVEFELNPGRPAGVALPVVIVSSTAGELGRVQLREGWQTYRVPLPHSGQTLTVVLQTTTFRPRTFASASSDNRELGVMLRRVAAQ